MEYTITKQKVNELAGKVCDFALTLRIFSTPNYGIKFARNSVVEKFGGVKGDTFVLTYKHIPIALYNSDGDFYDLTDILYFRTKKTDRIIRKFQKEYAPNFSVYYVFRY